MTTSNTKWKFYTDKDGSWRWRKVNAFERLVINSQKSFETEKECLDDAVKHGYEVGENVEIGENKSKNTVDSIVANLDSSLQDIKQGFGENVEISFEQNNFEEEDENRDTKNNLLLETKRQVKKFGEIFKKHSSGKNIYENEEKPSLNKQKKVYIGVILFIVLVIGLISLALTKPTIETRILKAESPEFETTAISSESYPKFTFEKEHLIKFPNKEGIISNNYQSAEADFQEGSNCVEITPLMDLFFFELKGSRSEEICFNLDEAEPALTLKEKREYLEIKEGKVSIELESEVGARLFIGSEEVGRFSALSQVFKIKAKEGENNWNMYVQDVAGNKSEVVRYSFQAVKKKEYTPSEDKNITIKYINDWDLEESDNSIILSKNDTKLTFEFNFEKYKENCRNSQGSESDVVTYSQFDDVFGYYKLEDKQVFNIARTIPEGCDSDKNVFLEYPVPFKNGFIKISLQGVEASPEFNQALRIVIDSTFPSY